MKQVFMSFLCLFLSISMCVTAQTYSSGSGSKNDPYLISSKTDMVTLANAVNGGNDYSGKYFLQIRDIPEGITTVIGVWNYPFKGIFDGGGHSLNINVNLVGWAYAGIFGYAEEATFINMIVTGNIVCTNNSGGYCRGNLRKCH